MNNLAAQTEWSKTKQKVTDWLGCDVSEDNLNGLNPRPVDVIIGFIMQDIRGDGLKMKLAAQRLNDIDDCILSWVCVLNNETRMKQVRGANKVAMAVADI
eukprot:831120-Ditylum_brightwellii.AAC.1